MVVTIKELNAWKGPHTSGLKEQLSGSELKKVQQATYPREDETEPTLSDYVTVGEFSKEDEDKNGWIDLYPAYLRSLRAFTSSDIGKWVWVNIEQEGGQFYKIKEQISGDEDGGGQLNVLKEQISDENPDRD